MIDVNARLFRAAYMCASTEEIRYYLNGVYVTPHPDGGAVLVATDGHKMIVVRDASGKCSGAKIVGIDRVGLNSLLGGKGTERRLTVGEDGHAEIVNVWRSAKTAIIDGTYPDWQGCIPLKKWKNAPASFNGENIGVFSKIVHALTRGACGAIRIYTDTESDPALVSFPSFEDAFGILMPMRADVKEGVPLWMRPIMKPVSRATPPAQSEMAQAA